MIYDLVFIYIFIFYTINIMDKGGLWDNISSHTSFDSMILFYAFIIIYVCVIYLLIKKLNNGVLLAILTPLLLGYIYTMNHKEYVESSIYLLIILIFFILIIFMYTKKQFNNLFYFNCIIILLNIYLLLLTYQLYIRS